MPQLAVMRPRPIFNLRNKLRIDKDCVSIPSGTDSEFANDQLVQLLPELTCGTLIDAGPHSSDIDELVSLARGE
ncbi:hypothetical protein AMK06_CH04081 [Rhizobium sp. N541]|nr:hypothetical protein AMK05_CH04194 [Rhizobium sp. N324]ANM18922.1 hypothetical protein AMK06_CH04081 [Rhizobium sp. N541]ANM25307.1 hypothetical protein AMK07_CH04077 [Rhizobium sp. N941]OWV89999.1 hypothetical protein ATY75_15435 [Rhizobium sp. N122]OYD01694.1 hypothetical protein AMK08_CH200098 [Rhizobium sp. N4311]